MTFPGSCWNVLPESSSIPWGAHLCQMLLPPGTRHGVMTLGVVSCSTVWDAASWRGCTPTVLAAQSLRASLTSTGPKLTFRSEERWRRHVITPLSYALLGGPKSSVICASTICSTFSEFVFYFFLGVCLCDVHKDFCGDKVHCGVPTIAVSLRLSESVFLLISSLPGPLQIATCLAIPQVYQTFPEVSHTQQWHNLSCFLRCS